KNLGRGAPRRRGRVSRGRAFPQSVHIRCRLVRVLPVPSRPGGGWIFFPTQGGEHGGGGRAVARLRTVGRSETGVRPAVRRLELGRVGESVQRPDATPKTTGEFAYAGDLNAAGLPWGP